MAKQKGILELAGALGGLSFYYLNGNPDGRYFVRFAVVEWLDGIVVF